jgi:hypothetical protein
MMAGLLTSHCHPERSASLRTNRSASLRTKPSAGLQAGCRVGLQTHAYGTPIVTVSVSATNHLRLRLLFENPASPHGDPESHEIRAVGAKLMSPALQRGEEGIDRAASLVGTTLATGHNFSPATELLIAKS